MSTSSSAEQDPLLSSPSSAALSYDSTTKSLSSIEANNLSPSQSHISDRLIENDVLPETTVLGRNLGWSSAYILIISRVIGSGIFATPGAITKSVGSVGLSLVLWVVGGLMAWFGLQISLEYGCMLPRSGGDKVYLEYTYRHPRFLASTLIAVQSVLLGFTASNCIVFAEYALFAFDKEATEFAQKTLAAGLLTAIIIVHGCFRNTGILIQNVLGWIKIALILFMVLTSLFVVLFRSRERETSIPSSVSGSFQAKQNYFWHGSVWDWGTIATALFKVFYSYAGLQNVNNVMNELKDPVRTLRSAATSALATASVLYILINVAYFLIVPMDDIKHSGELIAALFFERVFGTQLGRTILPLAIAISAAGNVMVVTFSHARVNQEIARQGFLPYARLLSSSAPFNSPLGGLVVHYIPSLLVILIPARNIYSFILEVEGYPGQFFALATSLGLIWLRTREPDLHRPYTASLGAVWCRIALSLALLAAPFVPDARDRGWVEHLRRVSYAFVGVGLLLFGVVYWYVWTVLLPRWGGYELDEAVEVLDDGTTITRLVHVDKLSRTERMRRRV